MDQTELKNKIGEYYAKLPESMQKIFSSMSWMQTLEKVSLEFKLTEEQKSVLGTETTLALLGIIHLEEYQNSIISDLKIDKRIADEIVTKIDAEIFQDIRPQLLNVYTTNITVASNNPSLDARFSSLPDRVKNAIAQSDYQNKLYAIAIKYKLPINKMADLENATVKILSGEISPKQYESELVSMMSLPTEKAEELLADINDGILKNIREIMKAPFRATTSDDMDIPLPPYTVRQTIENIPQKASGIYASAGIEIMDESSKEEKTPDETEVTKKEDAILEKSGIDMIQEKKIPESSHVLATAQTQKDTLEGIEHPEDVATSIIKDKLGGTIIGNVTKTNYSLPKMSAQIPVADTQAKDGSFLSKHDPYHEPIQ